MLAVLIGLTLVWALLFPRSTVGQVVWERLIRAPLQKLKRLRRPHAFGLAAAVIAVAALWFFLRTEGAMLLASGLPDFLQWFLVFDVVTYMDVAAVLALMAVSLRFRAIGMALRSVVDTVRRWTCALCTRARARAPRRRRLAQGRGGQADEEASWLPSPSYA